MIDNGPSSIFYDQWPMSKFSQLLKEVMSEGGVQKNLYFQPWHSVEATLAEK